MLHALGRGMFFAIGVYRIRVRGRVCDTAEAPILVMAPHSSFFDIVTEFIGRNLPSGVIRIENQNTPILGSMLYIVCILLTSYSLPDQYNLSCLASVLWALFQWCLLPVLYILMRTHILPVLNPYAAF